jgi:Flp pilus assembly protein TadG
MLNNIPGLLAPRWNAALSRWADARRGSAAVEFALIAVPFFFLLFGLLEIALIFIMGTVLEHAVNEAARDIRTGNFQDTTVPSGQTQEEFFKQKVCDRLMDLMTCDSRLKIDVQAETSFGGSSTTLTYKPPGDPDEGEIDDTGFGFEAGGADEVVVVRAYYEWSLITPIMSKPLESLPNGRHLLSAVAVFRNEPF